MSIAVLSPCLLQVKQGLTEQEELLHYSKLSELLQKLCLYTNLKFQYYKKAPYDGYKMEIPTYNRNLMLNNLIAVNVYAVIQKMLINDYIDLDGVSPATPPTTFSLPAGDLSEAFCSYINHLSGKEALIFVGEDNFHVSRPIEFYSDRPFKIDASTYVSIELTDILLPYLNEMIDDGAIFPRAAFCSNYNDYVKTQIKHKRMSQPQRIALYEQIGAVVAKYNRYEKDRYLTARNSTPSKIRIVYKKTIGKMSYLSFDVESGGFEVFDHKYNHLGQYNFSCKIARPPDPRNHKLIH